MKRAAFCKILCVLLAGVFMFAGAVPAFAGTPAEDAHLHFDADGKFRILNFSDIQDDEILDSRVKQFLPRAVYAAKPDLIVLTGDNIYGPDIYKPENTRRAIAEYMDIFESLGVPVAMVFGNHDDDDGILGRGEPLSKTEQMAFYSTYSVNISCDPDSNLSGCGTYNVPIYGSAQTDSVKFNLWMFDNGSGYVRNDQLDWYVRKSDALKEANGGVPVPSMAFQHIIVKEIYDALVEVPSGTPGNVYHNGHRYVLPDTAAPGSVMGEYPSAKKNGNEFSVMKRQGDVIAIVNGHDHKNQFVVPYQGIDLINTPTVGFYSEFNYSVSSSLRGARVIEIDEQTGTYTTWMLNLRDMLSEETYILPQKYVENVALCARSSMYSVTKKSAKKTALDDAYSTIYDAVDAANGNGVAVKEDLNGGPTDDADARNHVVVCMGYTLTENPDDAMRDLGLLFKNRINQQHNSQTQPQICDEDNLTGKDDRRWIQCGSGKKHTVRGTDGVVDLNKGTRGSGIYFVGDYSSTDRMLLSEIRIVNTGPEPIDMADYPGYQLTYAVVGDMNGSAYADLNAGAKGDYIYALYKIAEEKQNTLDSLPLRKACFNASKYLKAPVSMYTQDSRAALVQAVQDADVILRDLDDDRVTKVFDQSAIDQAARRINACISGLEQAAFTVTFDPAGGTCNVRTRVYACGAVCGPLPTAVRSRYVPDGWFTSPEGGERITEDTVFTALSDQTWYVHWKSDQTWVAGDADRDNCVDLRDVVMLQRYLIGERNAQFDVDHADVNADGSLDLRDVMLLRRYLAGGWKVALV